MTRLCQLILCPWNSLRWRSSTDRLGSSRDVHGVKREERFELESVGIILRQQIVKGSL